jgi:hypothetical protein
MAKHLSYLKTPGPGKYESLELNPKNGKFKISKFSDSKLTVIGKEKRFKPLHTTPGPLDYKAVDNFSDRGKFILSQRRGKGTRPFDNEKKFTVAYWKHNENPGPGAYEKPSEFGVYGDSQYYKSMGMTQ